MSTKNIDEIIALSEELRWEIGDDFHDNLAESIYSDASKIVEDAVTRDNEKSKFRFIGKS